MFISRKKKNALPHPASLLKNKLKKNNNNNPITVYTQELNGTFPENKIAKILTES